MEDFYFHDLNINSKLIKCFEFTLIVKEYSDLFKVGDEFHKGALGILFKCSLNDYLNKLNIYINIKR